MLEFFFFRMSSDVLAFKVPVLRASDFEFWIGVNDYYISTQILLTTLLFIDHFDQWIES